MKRLSASQGKSVKPFIMNIHICRRIYTYELIFVKAAHSSSTGGWRWYKFLLKL